MRNEERTQTSTFSSSVVPVFTSNNSGARYGIVLCSAAMSCMCDSVEHVQLIRAHNESEARRSELGQTCCVRACCLLVIYILAFVAEPKSIKIASPLSSIMIFLRWDKQQFLGNSVLFRSFQRRRTHAGLMSRCAYGTISPCPSPSAVPFRISSSSPSKTTSLSAPLDSIRSITCGILAP